jgi:hypothetical protein
MRASATTPRMSSRTRAFLRVRDLLFACGLRSGEDASRASQLHAGLSPVRPASVPPDSSPSLVLQSLNFSRHLPGPSLSASRVGCSTSGSSASSVLDFFSFPFSIFAFLFSSILFYFGGPSAACPKSKQSSIPSEAASLALIGFNPNVTSQNFTTLTWE